MLSGDAGPCQGVVVRGFDGARSADAGSSSVRAMIRFSSLRHCSAHRFCKEGWLISTTSGRQ